MRPTPQKICHAAFAVLAVAFAMKTFLYGGSTFRDPNDSPLYKSTLDRALANFEQSDLVLGGRVVPGSWASGSAGMAAGVGPGQEHAGHNHPLQGQGGADLGQAPQAQPDHGCKDVKAGLQLMQQGKFKEAAARFEFAVQEHLSSDTCVQNYLGMAYDKMGETEKSKQAYQKAAILAKAQSGNGVQHSDNVLGPDAIFGYSPLLPPVTVPAPGPSQDHAGHDHAQAIAPAPGQSQDHAGHDHQLQGQGGADLAQAPEDHGCSDMRAGLQFMRQGKFKEAAASFEVAVRCLPNDPCVRNHLGMVYDKMGETEKSKQAYQKAGMLRKAQ